MALNYVTGRRRRYYGPFAFLVVTVALAATAIAVTGFPAVTSPTPNAVADFLQHHFNLLLLVQVPFIAAGCRVLSPRGPFNYAEYLVLAAYSTGMRILFFTVVNVGGWYVLRPGAVAARALYLALMPVGPLYLGLACAQFLPGAKWLAAVKGVAAWLIGLALLYALVSAAGTIAELFARR